ncbi:xanthine dehydrogenase/oxidase [Plakobranchus ocellatus]|uniref:Xanthine dehydrogenase/oxidase n=1 Tax=Plakobranchus ocellatus TaxID=259542 RepID=A0AAV4CRV2_9GAST|nr:xanthine dehydrogenase/oxidase [Plakobranchus ocellatus]
MGSQCCKNLTNGDAHTIGNNNSTDVVQNGIEEIASQSLEVLGPKLSSLRPYDPTQEPIFPPDLKINHKEYHGVTVKISGPRVTWIRPTCLDEILQLKKRYPKARFVVGNT